MKLAQMKATLQGNQSLVLIVDNETFNRQQLQLLLEQSGYRVAEAKDGTQAINVFQQLHIERLAIPHINSQVSSHVTLSAGLATVIPDLGSNFEQIIAAADKALYQAKAAGRDCFKHNNLLLNMPSTYNIQVFVNRISMTG
nr:diguanylate cyclase [Nostoc sp. ChiQUE02]MDZ8232146.1 diguanylate cyclase [Nostoc sp. ChiQUE02]